MSEQRQSQGRVLSRETKRKLARQLQGTPTSQDAVSLFADWDTELALLLLLEFLENPRAFAHYTPLGLPSLTACSLCLALLELLMVPWETSAPLLLLLWAFNFVGIALLHRLWFPQAAEFRSHTRNTIRAMLPKATPAMIPTVLTAAGTLGSPDGHPTLRAALLRFLPLLTHAQAARLTESQRQYLRQLLSSSHDDLVVAALIAFGTLGDSAEAAAVRMRVHGTSAHVRAAQQECLELLTGSHPAR